MRRIWIDTDLALGTPRGDVDDGFAVAAVAACAALYPQEVELLGISVVAGNAPAGAALAALETLLAVTGTVSVVRGESAAPAAMAALPVGASILALGPPGNLLAAARLDPSWPARTLVRAVGTVARPWRHPLLRFYCFNFGRRRDQARAFFRLPFRECRMFPIDVIRRLRCGRRDLDAIAATGAVGAYLAAESERWLRQAPLRYRSRSFPLWDLVAALDALGRLPGAAFRPPGRLQRFDPEGARRGFLGLLRDAAGRAGPPARISLGK